MELLPSVRSAPSKRVFVLLLAPFAPHLAEELWQRLGGAFSVHTQSWPVLDQGLLAEEATEIPVQVDGRVRGTVVAAAGAPEDDVISAARAAVAAVPPPEGTARVVYVPGRVISFVSQER
jgi:leucyl-tRNA synthetase